jgi:hypothetical protein
MPSRTREPTKISNLKSIASHTWALDVTDDRTRGVVHELNADLGDTTTGTGTAEDTSDLDELSGLLAGGVHLDCRIGLDDNESDG